MLSSYLSYSKREWDVLCSWAEGWGIQGIGVAVWLNGEDALMNIGLFHSFLSNLIPIVLVLFHSHYLFMLFSTYLHSLSFSTSFPLFLCLLLSVLSTSSINPRFLFSFQSSSSSYLVSVLRSSLYPFYRLITVIFCLALSLVLPLFSPNFFPLPKWVLLSSLHSQAIPPSAP